MSATNNLTNTAVSNSGEVDSLLIEKYIGKVKERVIKNENLRRFFDVQSVTGTDMVSEKFMGGSATVQVLAPGEDPEASVAQYEKSALRVDTMLLSRYAEAIFHKVQSDIEGNQSKLAKMQGDEMLRIDDSMLVQQLVHSALSHTATAMDNKPRVDGQGFSQDVQIADTQAADPNSLLATIEYLHEQMVTEGEYSDGVDESGLYCLIRWPEFNALRDAERIVNQDYVDFAGNTISGFVLKSLNLPVIPTRRFPRVGSTDTSKEAALTRIKGKGSALLSNASNGYRYTPTADQTLAFAVIFNEEALLVGETMPLDGDIFFDKRSKSFLIDTWQSAGAIGSNWESVGVARKGAASANATITARAKRKAKPVTQIS